MTFGEATTDEMMIGFLDYTFTDQSKQVDMPTYAVPPELQEQMKKLREHRRQQKEKQSAGAGAGN